MSSEQNKALVRRLVEEIFNGGDMSLVDELAAPSFVDHELPPGTPPGREGLKVMLGAMRSAFPDFQATIEDMIAEGDQVFVRMTWSGTQAGEFMGIPPGGKRFAMGVFDLLRVEDGKIVEHWGQMDTMAMMQQLGAMPGPDQG